ncbi:MAG: aspartate aminotransferase family protein [Clostridiaceae bacterium]|jgi:glutamate/tyrosine decarboxylase-like PLP-dependent enzyme|nr:aspartate aminotransferase family protein [Clostridiaceae bacterium]
MKYIPDKGRPFDEILSDLETFGLDDPSYKEARTWSLVYYLNAEYTEFLQNAYGKYFSANGLNPTAFLSLKRLEKDILRYTAELLHVDENAAGVVTSCGTESCMLAVKTYRDIGRKKGIKKPEMILPDTAHVAWDKGAEYFNVKIRRASLAEDMAVDINAVEKMINKNTVMILGSSPEYPHGIIDPIEELGELAQKYNVPLHVDACVGGYILPYLEKLGVSLPKWDFRVPGVTSMTADIHKYGYAAKGASCILYRDLQTFKHQVFVQQDWPGGIFASPAFLGTRPGGAYAAAWAAIQANGIEGYTELAKKTLRATNRLKKGIEKIEGLKLYGDPKASLLAYHSTEPAINIFVVGKVMLDKGWHLDCLQRPDGIHAMVTASHTDEIVDKYLEDLAEAVKTAKAHPELADKGAAATYGMASHLPMRKMVKKEILNMFANSYRLNAKELDLENASEEMGGEEDGDDADSNSMPSFVTKIINWYVKRKSSKANKSK